MPSPVVIEPDLPAKEVLDKQKVALEIRNLRKPGWRSWTVLFGAIAAGGSIVKLYWDGNKTGLDRDRALFAKEKADSELKGIQGRIEQAQKDLAAAEAARRAAEDGLATAQSETRALSSRLDETAGELSALRNEVLAAATPTQFELVQARLKPTGGTPMADPAVEGFLERWYRLHRTSATDAPHVLPPELKFVDPKNLIDLDKKVRERVFRSPPGAGVNR